MYKKTKTYILMKTKTVFRKQRFGKSSQKEGIRVSSVKTYSNWGYQAPEHDYKLVRDYKLISSLIALS